MPWQHNVSLGFDTIWGEFYIQGSQIKVQNCCSASFWLKVAPLTDCENGSECVTSSKKKKGLIPAPTKWSQISCYISPIRTPPQWSQRSAVSKDWSESVWVSMATPLANQKLGYTPTFIEAFDCSDYNLNYKTNIMKKKRGLSKKCLKKWVAPPPWFKREGALLFWIPPLM